MLLAVALVPEELGVHTLERPLEARLGLLDTVSVVLVALVVRL